jgi:hypothetical protein
MGNQDANWNNQIFRKDNPIVLACRRDQAVFMGVRLLYDGFDYMAGECLVRVTSTGLFSRWATASGGTYDSPCVLFDQVTVPQFQASEQGATGGASGSALGRGLMKAVVYGANLVDYDSTFLAAIKGVVTYDSNATQMIRF